MESGVIRLLPMVGMSCASAYEISQESVKGGTYLNFQVSIIGPKPDSRLMLVKLGKMHAAVQNLVIGFDELK
jgi:hypothetical protein